jgi:hypothetical protein
MRRLRAVAAIVALAVIWLGYSVVREMAFGRPANPSVELQTASGTSTSDDSTTGAQVPKQSASVYAPLPNIGSAEVLPPTGEGATVFAAEASLTATPQDELEASPVPFFQAALSDVQAGTVSGAHGRPGGAFGGGGVPPMWGGGAGGGASAESPLAADDTELSGDGKPSVLGHRLLADSGEPTEGSGPAENGSNASNGSSGGSGGSNDEPGDTNGNSGTNGDNGLIAGNGSTGDNGSNGGNGSNGSSETGGSNQGGSGGDQGGVPEGGINSLAVSLADESPTTTGDAVLDVPEPGSILLGLGVLAALVRRRTR